MSRLGPLFFAFVFSLLPFPAHGEAVKGIYGVPSIRSVDPSSYVGELEKAGVNAVFVPPEEETVRWFKNRGFQVYVSVNAFGGKGAWKKYPDSRPVKSNGKYLGSTPGYKGHGGVCPTHTGWRQERLKHIESIVKNFGGEDGAGGIWLDFIRYPGVWEVPEPEIPDTCYCPRCLAKFQQESGVKIPSGLGAKGSAAWIKENCLYRWMVWKKAQIESFVLETRDVMEKNQGKKPLKLGLFLVPWTKGERGDAISYLLAQDPFQISALADVISPMVYHKMCGKSEEWVGYMSAYYGETASCQVWPIVQSADCKAEELSAVMKYAGQGGADGILAFSFKGMKPNMWACFREFHRLPNLIRKKSADYPGTISRSYPRGIGSAFHRAGGAGADCAEKRVKCLEGEKKGIGVTAEDEWGEEWVAPLSECEPGAEYVFRGDFFRKGWRNGVYPSVSLWGEEFLVDTHLKAKVFQPIRVNVVCPDEISDPYFRFINRNRGTTFRMVRPSLKRHYRFTGEPEIVPAKAFFPGGFFPIGVYGAGLGNLEQIKRLAINTVILGGRGANLKKKIEKCHEVGLRYVLSVPHDPDQLPVFLDEISGYVRPYDLAFYVNDEPGIWSFPVNRADDINQLIKDRFPGVSTCMAVVRPQVCRDFRWAADFFMLDQYPVPYMPMTWLSDSMDECAGGLAVNGMAQSRKVAKEKVNSYSLLVNSNKKRGGDQGSRITNQQITNNIARGRLASVIQAFGGQRYADVGWPRLPTWQEMDCLAFLSVVHGSRGIFFYTFSWIGKTEEGRERLGRVVGRLNRVYPWLVVENSGERVQVEMLSENRFDPKGRVAVHCCVKRKGREWMVIAVNTIGTGVEALLGAEVNGYSLLVNGKRERGQSKDEWMNGRLDEKQCRMQVAREVFSGEDYVVVDGKIRVRFGPYETKAFLSTDSADPPAIARHERAGFRRLEKNER
ncbi:MAG: hypothetical protein U9N82_03490 [Thermodesulfobacteriota bacterium]|nr:hypothetical protein [Thermodesulfobacteriota bacterium]